MNKRNWITLGALVILCLIILTCSICYTVTQLHPKHYEVNILTDSFQEPVMSALMTESDFKYLKSIGMISYDSYETYQASVLSAASLTSTASLTNLSDANALLYNMADTYFQVYYGSQRVSPILPMAISNVETPGRADHNITWCALFPSRIVDVSQIETFNVTDVLKDENVFKALSTEYSTRDRGCLQMSPTYGTGNASVNQRMSGTEKDKLASMSTSHTAWVSGASSSSGDRFYLPDVLLRLQAAFQGQVENILNNDYQPASDLQLVAMLAMSHQSSGVWGKTHSKKIGCWLTGDKAFEWSQIASSPEVIGVLTQYATSHDDYYIDTAKAQELFSSVRSEQFSSYATNSNVCTYPIKCLYAYIKLSQLYTR